MEDGGEVEGRDALGRVELHKHMQAVKHGAFHWHVVAARRPLGTWVVHTAKVELSKLVGDE